MELPVYQNVQVSKQDCIQAFSMIRKEEFENDHRDVVFWEERCLCLSDQHSWKQQRSSTKVYQAHTCLKFSFCEL